MKKFCPGYTLVELLLVISFIALLASFGMAKYIQFNRRQIVVQAAQELKSNLRFAQDKALAGEKPTGCTGALSGHKLEFLNNRDYKIVAVCGGDINVKTGLTLGSNVTKTSGPSSILFKVLAQGVVGYGTINISGYGITQTITVTEAGEIK